MVPKSEPDITSISAERLVKAAKGNDIWEMAVVQSVPKHVVNNVPSIPAAIKMLINQYDEVFKDSKYLPPSRMYDHTISLLPTATPVNSRPYRYSPLQKDEIERQVNEMLAAGLITPSMSPFASPVLLVKKMVPGIFVLITGSLMKLLHCWRNAY